MKRQYSNSAEKILTHFFIGTEVEQSPAQGMLTLFVTGVQPVEEIVTRAEIEYGETNATEKIKHIYCGANMSYHPTTPEEYKEWDEMILALLKRDYWVTLDFDVSHAEEVHEGGLSEYRRFIPMVSVKLPYISLFNYNTTIKIDDRGFDATNPGIWCHRLYDLMDKDKFTSWDAYSGDTAI